MTELPDRLLRDALRDAASTTPSAACVDAVTLAAWAEGTLRGAERATIEAHAAGCARCLALLAAMTRTEPPIAPPWWRRSPIAWLLPLAAVTAGVVLAVRLAVLEQRSAASRPTPAPAAAAPPQRSVPQAPPAPAQTPVTSVASKAPTPARRQKHEPAAAEAGRTAGAATEVAANDTATPKPTAAPAPAPEAPAHTPPSAQLAASSAVGDQMGGRGGGGARALAAKSTMKAAALAQIVIASPDRDSQWRIAGGAVEHTADGGATWQAQPIGVATPMRAGAAPDARVCWLAGVAGVVLRTTDGNIWTRVPFPEAVDLVAIEATDASHAAVTTVDGRRFATSDGGAIWIRQ
jgi:hypothetical protein